MLIPSRCVLPLRLGPWHHHHHLFLAHLCLWSNTSFTHSHVPELEVGVDAQGILRSLWIQKVTQHTSTMDFQAVEASPRSHIHTKLFDYMTQTHSAFVPVLLPCASSVVWVGMMIELHSCNSIKIHMATRGLELCLETSSAHTHITRHQDHHTSNQNKVDDKREDRRNIWSRCGEVMGSPSMCLLLLVLNSHSLLLISPGRKGTASRGH